MEIGTGNYPGDAHCKPDELLADPAKAKAFKAAVTSRGLEISGLSQHGNPAHPDEAFRTRDGATFHTHAKDTYLDRGNIARTGVLDTKPYDQVADRVDVPDRRLRDGHGSGGRS